MKLISHILRSCDTWEICTSCNENYWLYLSNCDTSCPVDHWWPNNSTWTCDECHETCLRCNGANFDNCTLCDVVGTYPYQYGSTCLTECPTKTYTDGFFCYDCNETCAECSGPAYNECILCTGDLYLYIGECLNPCPDNFYKNATDNTEF